MNVWQQEIPGSEGVYLVHVGGRLDQSLTPKLETNLTELLDQGQIHLIVDLTETTYINSGGLRCLVSAWRKSPAAGRRPLFMWLKPPSSGDILHDRVR